MERKAGILELLYHLILWGDLEQQQMDNFTNGELNLEQAREVANILRALA
jgi:hypothetical protein